MLETKYVRAKFEMLVAVFALIICHQQPLSFNMIVKPFTRLKSRPELKTTEASRFVTKSLFVIEGLFKVDLYLD